jgi:hypothetical protein
MPSNLIEEDAEAVRAWLASAQPGFERLSLPAMAEAAAYLVWTFESWAALAGRRGSQTEVQRIAQRIGHEAAEGVTLTAEKMRTERARARAVFVAGGCIADLKRQG